MSITFHEMNNKTQIYFHGSKIIDTYFIYKLYQINMQWSMTGPPENLTHYPDNI